MKVSTDPWQHILESIEPTYQDLYQSSMYGPTIKPRLFKSRNKWQILLEEIWPWLGYLDVKGPLTQFRSSRLDNSVEWCEKTLRTWKNCRRESCDTWSFNSKKDAEKFITYYNLACPHFIKQ